MIRAPETSFTLRRIQEMLGLSRRVLYGLVDAGFVAPTRGARNTLLFTFQDLMLLKTAHQLQQSGIASRRILSSLRRLKATLPEDMPLEGLRITAVGSDVAVRGRDGGLADASGQLLMDFDVAQSAGTVTILDRAKQSPEVSNAGEASEYYRQGEALEAQDPKSSETAYRQAIALAADFADAYVNLSALLCDEGRYAEAAALLEGAAVRCLPTALIYFNQGIALEECGQLRESVASYERSLAIDPGLADAHYNIGQLQDKLGDPRRALRHYNAYRRLQSRLN